MSKIINKRVKSILKVEEPYLVKLAVDTLKKRPSPNYLNQVLYDVLDDATHGFVLSIWKAMVFENKKYDAGIHTSKLI